MLPVASAMPVEETSDYAEEVLQLVSFHVGPEEYAIDILCVQEIIRIVEITKVPKAPHYVEGVINLRGKVIPIVDLRSRFGLSPADRTKETRIIVVDVGRMIMGLIVDAVSEVLRVPLHLIEPPPNARQGPTEFHKGVGKLDGRLLILLDLDRMLAKGTV